MSANATGIQRANRKFPEISRLFNENLENTPGLILCIAGVKPGFYGSFTNDPMSGMVIPLKELPARMNALKKIIGECGLHMDVNEDIPWLANHLNRRWECEFLVCDKKDSERVQISKQIFKEKDYEKRDGLVGYFLGYPKCCVDHYSDPKKRRQTHNIGRFQRFIGYKPCSDKCEESLKLGDLYARSIKEVSKELFQKLEEKRDE